MELASNILYLLICLGLAGAWSSRAVRSKRYGWRYSLGAVALVCLLLFPAISATDDLQMAITANSTASLEDVHKQSAHGLGSPAPANTFHLNFTVAAAPALLHVPLVSKRELDSPGAHGFAALFAIVPQVAHRPPPDLVL